MRKDGSGKALQGNGTKTLLVQAAIAVGKASRGYNFRSSRGSTPGPLRALLPLLIMAFAACARPPASPPPAALQEQSSIVELPLKRGFYVASDTACDAASNATLLLLRRDGIGGARDFCEFRSIERTGPASFRVAEACSDLQSAEAEVNEGQVVFANYTLEGDGAYIRVQDSGWESQARYCEQESLPADWRDIDISDVVE